MQLWKIKRRFFQGIILIKYIIIMIYVKIFKIKENCNEYKDLWVISERGNDARDNAFVFFRYIREKYPNINIKYIISTKSPDYSKVKELGDVIEFGSVEHYKSIILAKVLISTHIMGYTPQMNLFMFLDKFKFTKLQGKKIFLQHGIIKDKMNLKSSLDIFISGADRECEFLKQTYPEYKEVIKNTGLARYDLLNSNEKKQILIMPTWRLYLSDCKDISKYDYYKCYNELLNDDEIIKLLENNGYKLYFYPHYEMQKFLYMYKTKRPDIIKIATFKEYDVQKLLIESNILITDFSSVFFDFAYMRKPVIYYQFDEKDYRDTQYQKGYFDYKVDGFGKVVKEKKQLIEELDNILKNNGKISEEYKKRINAFFGKKVGKEGNCDKIFKEVIKVIEGDKNGKNCNNNY